MPSSCPWSNFQSGSMTAADDLLMRNANNPFWSNAYHLPMLAPDGVFSTKVEQKTT
jgi:hypothetical protein